jgi:hypothetical protein
MNKLALAIVLAALISQAAGCVVEVADRGDDDPGAEVASISARWSLRNMIDGAVTACPQGFDTVEVIAQAIDDAGEPVGDVHADLFDCSRRTGTSTALFPDLYQVWIEVRSHDLSLLYAQSLSQYIDVREFDQKFSTEVLNDGGYFQLAWDLVGRTSNRPVACSQVVGLDTITAVSASIADAQRVYDDNLVCEDHATVTGGLLQGTYTISLDVIAADMSISAAPTLTNKVISGQNRVTDLGHIAIPIDGL